MLPAGAGTANADTITYANSRFGTQITFPAELFETRHEPPANGDGMSWASADGASLAVYGSYNVVEITPSAYLRQIVEERNRDGAVTYSLGRDGWVVVSGTRGSDIFYERHLFGAEDVIHSMILTYPRSRQDDYNPVAGPIANSLTGP